MSLPGGARASGLAYGRRDVGAASRYGVGVDQAQGFTKRTVVERDRTNQEGAARERDDAHGIAVELPGKVVDRQLCPRQAVGLHVGRGHAARGVDREHDVVSPPRDLFPSIPDQRSRQREEQAGHGSEVQAAPRSPTRYRDRTGQLQPQMCRDELFQGGLLAAIVAVPHADQHEAAEGAGRQPPGMAEFHGNLRSRVC